MVRSLSRGLDIIYFLNQHHSASPTELATELKVPRATVHRILQTLKEKGYVYQHESDRKFRLTYRVLSLSQGFSDEDYMANLGMDVMEEVTRALIWPVSLATISGVDVIVRNNTDASSKLAVEKYKIGYRLPILSSASGVCILAHLTESERENILAMIRKLSRQRDQSERTHTELNRLFKRTVRDGYATFRRKRERFDISAIAVPIFANNEVHGALTLRYTEPALTKEETSTVIVPMLRDAAKTFTSKLQRHIESKSHKKLV